LEAEMLDSNHIVICGKDYETPNEIHCQVIADSKIGLGISVGTTSKANEDCLGVSMLEDDVLFAIADGHWGREASELAIQRAMDLFRSADHLPKENEIRARFYALFEQINGELFEMAMANPGASAPETTLIVCHLKEIESEKYLYWSSFGDSYLFLLRKEQLKQLNTLNSFWLGYLSKLSENADTRSILMKFLSDEARYVGVPSGLETGIEKLEPGDIVFLCSDGLIGSDREPEQAVLEEIKDILAPDQPLLSKAEKAVASALNRGEIDNISCVVTLVS
jgi:Serine/threonine protein phosphatase